MCCFLRVMCRLFKLSQDNSKSVGFFSQNASISTRHTVSPALSSHVSPSSLAQSRTHTFGHTPFFLVHTPFHFNQPPTSQQLWPHPFSSCPHPLSLLISLPLTIDCSSLATMRAVGLPFSTNQCKGSSYFLMQTSYHNPDKITTLKG